MANPTLLKLVFLGACVTAIQASGGCPDKEVGTGSETDAQLVKECTACIDSAVKAGCKVLLSSFSFPDLLVTPLPSTPPPPPCLTHPPPPPLPTSPFAYPLPTLTSLTLSQDTKILP
jgi:hypothetical protein